MSPEPDSLPGLRSQWTRFLRRAASSKETLAAADERLAKVSMAEMASVVLSRALDPFPAPVRTVDALHLATLLYPRGRGQDPRLCTYDGKMRAAAEALELPLADPGAPLG